MNEQKQPANEKNLNESPEKEIFSAPMITNTNRYKMIFLALLEGAMRYREAYYRDEADEYNNMLALSADGASKEKKMNGSTQRRLESRVKGMSLDFIQNLEKFNNAAYKEIEQVTAQFTKKADTTFDNYSTGFGLMLEQYINAKDTSDILTICEAYNLGLLDELLKAIKENKSE